MRVSIKTIAKLAECSTATVSNILNDKGAFSESTKKKVLEIVKANNYTRNAIGRNLRLGRSETVGITFYRPNADIFRHEFYLNMMGALERTFAENNYEIILSEYTDTMVGRGELPPFLAKGKADAMIVLGGFPKESLKIFAESGYPVVMLDTYDDSCDCVITDGRAAVENAMGEISKRGYKSADFFGFGVPDYNTDMRVAGFLSGVEKFGFDKSRCRVCRNFFDVGGAVAEFEKMLASPRRPEVVLASNDRLAAELLAAAKDAGLRVPEDIGFVGFDDTPLAEMVSPKLCTVRTDVGQMGRRGAMLALRRIADRNAERVVDVSVPQFVARGSLK